MRVWIAYDNSPARLPIALADSVKELAKMTGANEMTIRSTANRHKNGIFKSPKYVCVDLEDE